MKTCVFITGTNAVGKSALAWAIIDRFGGVDRITNDRGSSCTSRLASVVEEGLQYADIIVCEGSYMNTFGLNLTNAMFKAERHLIVNLYADGQTLYSRCTARSNGMHGKSGNRAWDKIFNKQRQSMIAAKKWQSIGVKVLQINTATMPLDEELELVLKAISDLCGKPTITR